MYANARTRHRDVVRMLDESEAERLRLRAYHDRVSGQRGLRAVRGGRS